MSKNINIHLYIFILLLSFKPIFIMGQDSTRSLAFKNNNWESYPSIFYRPNLSYQLWQHFKLIQDANEGDAMAEHELGIRYLLGEGFTRDTNQAAFWIGKAAKQKLTGACFNYGILLNNGWGVEWNPFKAFDYFLEAAKDDMPQAEYLVGLSYTDNLIVKRNWSKSYFWLQKSAKYGFVPAQDAIKELLKRIPASSIDTTDTSSNVVKNNFNSNNPDSNVLSSSTGLVFIDFSTVKDTMQQVTDRIIIEDILHQGNDSLAKALNISFNNDSSLSFKDSGLVILKSFAENGSPEALTLLGKLYEEGIYFKKDLILSSEYYIRAAKLDSPRAPFLLWKETHTENYFQRLKVLIQKNDPRAMFVWYGLFSLEIDNQITPQQAEKFLTESASLNFIPSLNELGIDYYTGKIFPKNITKAEQILIASQNLGSIEAKIQLAIMNLFRNSGNNDKTIDIKFLEQYSEKGSVLAQAGLGYCYENGISVKTNYGLAAKYLRFAAQRGSQFAYNSLKKMYNEIRPNNPEFTISE